MGAMTLHLTDIPWLVDMKPQYYFRTNDAKSCGERVVVVVTSTSHGAWCADDGVCRLLT